MTLLRIIAPGQAALMARNAILMRLHASIASIPECAKANTVILLPIRPVLRRLLLPAQRQVRSRHDLDKVHEIVVRIVRLLLGVVQGIQMVVRPECVLPVAAQLAD